MIIKNVTTCGFDRIYEGYKNSFQEHRQGYGNNFFSYLSHSMITIELEEITMIELFYLKSFATSIQIIDTTYENFENPETHIDTHQKIDELLKLHDQMLNDDDINKLTTSIDGILPAGCIRYHLIAIFSGRGITAVTGIMVNKVFNDEKDIFPDEYMGEMILEKKLAEFFYKNFYTFMSDRMGELDVVTEFMINKKFYQYVDSIGCSLSHVNTPFGELQFFGNSSDKLQFQLRKLQERKQEAPYYMEEQNYLNFVFRTTFHTFMKIYAETDYITDHENLKIVFANAEVDLHDDIMTKYEARISSSLDYLKSYKDELLQETTINLNKFNYIINGNLISYSVQIPFHKVGMLIELLHGDVELDMIRNDLSNARNFIQPFIS